MSIEYYLCIFSYKFPSSYLKNEQFELIVAVVIEQRDENQVTWHLDTRNRFLHDDTQTGTMYCNPFRMNINRLNLTNDGIFKYVSDKFYILS